MQNEIKFICVQECNNINRCIDTKDRIIAKMFLDEEMKYCNKIKQPIWEVYRNVK